MAIANFVPWIGFFVKLFGVVFSFIDSLK
jgi:hypothetical protein